MTTEVKRSQRVSERVREELALLLRTLSDPRIVDAVVTRVEVSDDMSFVRAFVRRDAGASPAEQKSLLRGICASSANPSSIWWIEQYAQKTK